MITPPLGGVCAGRLVASVWKRRAGTGDLLAKHRGTQADLGASFLCRNRHHCAAWLGSTLDQHALPQLAQYVSANVTTALKYKANKILLAGCLCRATGTQPNREKLCIDAFNWLTTAMLVEPDRTWNCPADCNRSIHQCSRCSKRTEQNSHLRGIHLLSLPRWCDCAPTIRDRGLIARAT